MKGQHVSEEQFSVALPSVLSLHFVSEEEVVIKKRKPPKAPTKKGWERAGIDKTDDPEIEETQEIRAVPSDPTKTFLSVHWSGDSDLEDTRIWMHTSITDPAVNGGLKTTGELLVFNAFELVKFKKR